MSTKFIPIPSEFNRTNGGVRCDMAEGPCACGAWHFVTYGTFKRKLIGTPATCKKCNAGITVNGAIISQCFCGGELITDKVIAQS